MKKKSKLEKFTPFVIGTCMLTLVAACGSDDDDSGSGSGADEQQERPQEGQYRVVLSPVNMNVAGSATGSGSFLIAGDEFSSTLQVDGAPSGTHIQHVHVGSRCATLGDDENGDGYIDAVEAGNISGGALIPLDSDLRSQEAGGRYPSGASYSYNETTSFQTMLADLRLEDTNTNDILVKLGADEDLNLEGKVVQIHGLPATTTLPPTVRGVDGLSPQQALPILCGVITREETQDDGSTTGDTGSTTGDTGSTTGDTGSTTGDTGSTTGDDGSTTGDTGSTTGDDGSTTGDTEATTTGFTGN